MNLLKNVKLTPVFSGVEQIQEQDKEVKTDTEYNHTEVPKVDSIEASLEEVSDIEEDTKTVPSQEVLIPLDPEARSSRKLEHLPANIFISQIISPDGNMTYRVYLTSSINKVLPYVIQFLENVPENCEVILILSSMNICKLGVATLLSTMASCKAKITTHANSITSLTDMAVWASGNTLTVSEVAFIILRNMCTGTSGNVEDVKVHLEMIERIQDRIKNLLLSKNIITEEESISIFEDNKVAFFTGTELKRRLAE